MVTARTGRREKRRATLNRHCTSTAGPDADQRLADAGLPGETVAVTLTGTNFVVGATTVNVGGGGVTVNDVVVGSSTLLTASFVLDSTTSRSPRSDGQDSRREKRRANLHESRSRGSKTFNFMGSTTLRCPTASSASPLWPAARGALLG